VPEPTFDALLPPEMARRAEEVGVRKASMPTSAAFALGVLAGAFIGLGAMLACVVWTDPTGAMPWGLGRLVGGLAFAVGLCLVVVGGAELFTGNALIVMAWASGRVATSAVLRSWAIVYAGNAVGALGTAALVFSARHWSLADGAVGRTMLEVALAKCRLGFVQAVALGVLCNALVCLAVWLTFSARTTVDRVAAVLLPVATFVAAGFEHSIANIYIVPVAILVRLGAPDAFWTGIGRTSMDYADVNAWTFAVHNLAPVTFGNVLGGTVLVGGVYWAVYLRRVDRSR
jgi:formate/nitrite transporter